MRIIGVSRNYWRGGRAALASAATLMAVAVGTATSGPPAQAAVGHRPDASTPDTISINSRLMGVSADSSTDAWAVGYYDNSSGVDVPLTLHWNGQTWGKAPVSAPNGAQGTSLSGVSADSPNDAWAVGSYENSSGMEVPLTMHRNGTRWKQVASPLPSGATAGALVGVSADSPSDAWAVGYYESSSGQRALLLHWNGTKWKQVASPLPSGGTGPSLVGVSAFSVNDVWAVGSYTQSGGGGVALALHWNGKAWKLVQSPAISGASAFTLSAVSPVSATDTWMTGWYQNSTGVFVPLVLHCAGTTCKQVTSPAPSGAKYVFLEGVSAVSAADVWVSGFYANSSGVIVPLILRCSGTACKQSSTPTPGGTQSLSGVSAASATDAWAVGSYEANATTKTLTLHWSGTAWKQVKSPNGG